MTTRIVTGLVLDGEEEPIPDSPVTFYLREGSFTETAIYPPSSVATTTDEDGTFAAELWCNSDGVTPSRWIVVLPNDESYRFILTPGAPITLMSLLLDQVLDEDDWPPPVVSDDAVALLRQDLANPNNAALGDALISYRNPLGIGLARTVHGKLAETFSVFDVIDEDEHADIRNNTSTYDVSEEMNSAIQSGYTTEVPAGTYRLSSTLGSGFNLYTILIEDKSDFIFRGQPGSQFIADTGSNIRSIIFRRCTNFEVTGITLINEATATAGLCFENCTNGRIHKNTVIGFGRYGIVGSENTGTFQRMSSGISFDGPTQEIRDVAGAFTGVLAADRLFIGNSASNNGFTTVASVNVDGSIITVDQVEDGDITLVTEAAGASTGTLTSDTISMTDSLLSVTDGLLYFLTDNDSFTIEDSDFNDGTYTVVDVAPDGLSLTVAETFVTETAGAEITLTRIGRPLVQVVDYDALDNMVIDDNYVQDCGYFGIEWFAKAKSSNLEITNNKTIGCGLGVTAGSGIKGGANYDKVKIAGNFVSYCQMGILLGNFEDTAVYDNHITNCEKWPLAITISSHIKAPATRFGSLLVHNNNIEFTLDPSTGERFLPTIANAQWLNINGLIDVVDLIDIHHNTVVRWGADADGYGTGGIQINKSYLPYPNIRIHHNTVIDSGGLLVVPMQNFTCTTTDGSPVLSSIANFNAGATQPTAGWLAGAQVVGAGIPAEARILSIDVGANTMTLSVNATATASDVIIRSGIPLGLEFSDNHLISTAPSSANVVLMLSDDGRCENNLIDGFGQYPVQALCSEGYAFWLTRNTIIRPNQDTSPVVANRGPFFLGRPLVSYGTAKDILGTYHVYNNRLELGDGHATYMVNSTSAGTLYMFGNWSSDETIQAIISGGVAPSSSTLMDIGARRTSQGTAAPTSGTRLVGDHRTNTAPSLAKPIAGWLTVGGGDPGLHVSFGGIGLGTTAQRPSPTSSEKMFYINTSTNELQLWTGSAWKVVASIA